ncbi:MAG TPA: hypothetical protein VGO93_21985 [Candidatus Xenobia bacterium]
MGGLSLPLWLAPLRPWPWFQLLPLGMYAVAVHRRTNGLLTPLLVHVIVDATIFLLVVYR